MTETPKPNDLPERAYRFHFKPRGGCNEPCPLCGLPGTRRGHHRAIRPEEPYPATHMILRSSGVRVLVGCDGGPKPRPREILDLPKGHRMVSTVVRERIARAARLHAEGSTFEEIAKRLHVSTSSVSSWKKKYARLWRYDFRRALDALNKAMETEPERELEARRQQLAAYVRGQVEEQLAQFEGRILAEQQELLAKLDLNNTQVRELNQAIAQRLRLPKGVLAEGLSRGLPFRF